MRAYAALLLIVLLCGPAYAERVALLIGNADYAHVQRLENPENDIQEVAAALRRQGFRVTERHDRSRAEMVSDLREFRTAADAAEIALVYYAGHGIEVGGENFLVPVDAGLADQRDVPVQSISLDNVLRHISGARTLKMIVLDACRNNPFVSRMVRANRGRDVSRGLSRVEPRQSNTLIAYAAAAGAITPDGPKGRNSPFTAAFLEALSGPPRDVRLLLGAVRDGLQRRIGPDAEPFIYASLGGQQVVLNPSGGATADAAAQVGAGVPEFAEPEDTGGHSGSVKDPAAKAALDRPLRPDPPPSDTAETGAANAEDERRETVLAAIPPATPGANAELARVRAELEERRSSLARNLLAYDGLERMLVLPRNPARPPRLTFVRIEVVSVAGEEALAELSFNVETEWGRTLVADVFSLRRDGRDLVITGHGDAAQAEVMAGE